MPATVTILMTNTAPVALPDTGDDGWSTSHNWTLHVESPGVMRNDYDPDLFDGPRRAEVVDHPALDTYDDFTFQSNGSFSFDPKDDFTGTATFTYHVFDGADYVSNTASVTITVTNAKPLAYDDPDLGSYEAIPGETLHVSPGEILANDYDEDGDRPQVSSYTVPAGADFFDLDPDTGEFWYKPALTFAGETSFTYYINDGFEDSEQPATVWLNVYPRADLDIELFDELEEDDPGAVAIRNGGQTPTPPRVKIILRGSLHPGYGDTHTITQDADKVNIYTTRASAHSA